MDQDHLGSMKLLVDINGVLDSDQPHSVTQIVEKIAQIGEPRWKNQENDGHE
jgi:hypothetical protein